MCGGGGGGGKSEAEEQAERSAREARQRHQALVGQQMNEANEFRNRLPLLENQMGESLTQQSRTQLAQDLNANKVDHNRRGLLYSRSKDIREGGLRAEAGGNLADARQQVSTRLREQSRNMDNYAAQGALDSYRQAQQTENQIYQNALMRVQQRNQAITQAAQAGGAGAALLASRS